MELLVWIVSLGSVFFVGWAAGRASKRRPVIVSFPEFPPIDRMVPTAAEVAAAMRNTTGEDAA